jgi:O-antigen/teichoic acid export membrane protein
MALMVAQVAAMPLSLLNNVVMARYLGPDDFGLLYLVGTAWTFGILFVEWGQSSTVTALIAKEPTRVGETLGTSLAWRATTVPLVYLLMAGGAALLRQGRECQVALALMALVFAVYTGSSAIQDALRGLERMEMPAKGVVAQQILNFCFVTPILLLGGRLSAVLVGQAAAMLVVAGWAARTLRQLPNTSPRFRAGTLKHLLVAGSPFLVLNISLALQPNVDALLLAKLAPPESLGWFAAAKRLVGVLIFPATALATAFYPTWVRLWNDDRDGFRRAVSTGLRASTVLVAPIALGCALYPDIGIRAFSRHEFGPAEADVRVLSVFVLALFYSMILAVAITASGRSRAWAVCQFSCVVVSAVLDPLLVPYCQHRYGNGSLGVCASTVVSEVLIVVAGGALLPRGILDRRLARTLGLTVVAGLAMVAAARLLSGVTSFVAAPIAVVAYGVCLWGTGGVDPALVDLIRNSVTRRFARTPA